jgi:hypothetical protein
LLSVNSSGLKFKLVHNNTDFPRNPSYGSRQKLILTRDFGWRESVDPWANIELELTKYLDLGKISGMRQSVLAFNFWTSHTGSWEVDPANPQIVHHRPPPGVGSALGGFDRLRAYPTARFHDKSAVYYGAELRMIPQTRPLRDIPLLYYFDIDWLQVVGFAEAGRVAPDYNTDLFVKDLKYDVGLSLRLMTYLAVVRLDWAVSDEGHSIWAMFEQPFAR